MSIAEPISPTLTAPSAVPTIGISGYLKLEIRPYKMRRAIRCIRYPGIRHTGLAVGRDPVALLATIGEFARRFFGPATKTRFRPSFFPFTEPSAEVDVSCTVCGGTGCSACKGSGWLEIMGAGMVDPNVFDNVGYDSERYTGFAFGMGIDRTLMFATGAADAPENVGPDQPPAQEPPPG